MANFDEHIKQSKQNLTFLNDINLNVDNHWDWKVTVSFYVAVHLINSHIAKKANQHYRSHSEVSNALFPENLTSICKLNDREYTAYKKLQNLSRRARYLCHDDSSNRSTDVHFTYDRHFAKAIKNLEILLTFIAKEYKVSFSKTKLKCIDLKGIDFENFMLA